MNHVYPPAQSAARRYTVVTLLFLISFGLSSTRTSGACITPPPDLAAWWRLDGDGMEASGGAAFVLSGGAAFGAAKVGTGLVLDGSNDSGRANASPALNVGTAPGLTVEGWIRPVDASRLMNIVEWNNGLGGIGLHLSTSTTGTRDFYANLVDTAGVSHQVFSGSGVVQDGVFQHVALTYNRTTGQTVLYRNGGVVGQTNLGVFIPQTSYPFYVGTRASGPFQGIWFAGVIDELSLFRRALSAAEIQTIFAAGAAGKCVTPQPLQIVANPQSLSITQGASAAFSVVAQGTSPLRYQWLQNGTPLTGATQSVLSLATVQVSQSGAYVAVVSDATGSVTSAPATLTVSAPLGILTPPQSVMTVAGLTARFFVVAQSSTPISYQWFFNGSPLGGATAAALELPNVQVSQAGRYAVRVANASQSLTSAPVALTVLPGAGPVITEFMAENRGTLLDEDGDASDWIEVFNPGPGAVNLQNWSLTDDSLDLVRWRFPGATLPANAYLLVFASAKNRSVPGAPLHTNFRLDQDGGYLALVQPDGLTVASEFNLYPPQRSDVSFGLAGGNVYFTAPTPAGANNSGVLGFVHDTKFDTNRGFFFSLFDLAISCATPGATIVYTTNGDEPSLTTGIQAPSLNSTSLPQAILRLASTTTLRAAAFKDGLVSSGVDTHSYIFPASVASQTRPPGASASWIEDPPGSGSFPADFTVDPAVVNGALPGYSFTNALMALPAISVVTPMDGFFGLVNGIYTHPLLEGTNWERAASVELIYPDGHEGFHVGAGVQIHGAVSQLPHTIPKHPLRLLFRERYGVTKLEYPLFPGSVQKFDQLVLRGCSTDAWPISNDIDFLWRNQDATYQRDQWMRDAQLAMGHTAARGIYVNLYVNGLYWGLYNLTEKLNDSFFSDRLGGQKEEWDVVTDFEGIAVSGTRDLWTQLLQLSGQAQNNANILLQIQGKNPDGTRNTNFPVLINLDNFIDYMALHIYSAAIDWPGRNWWAACRRGPDSAGFHFFTWDQEIAIDRLDRTGTWGVSPANIESVYEPNTVGQVYDGLRRDAEFKLRFADRLQKHLFNGGVLTLQSNVARWALRAAEIDHAIVGESARWGDAKRSPAYNRQNDWLRMSNFTANTYFSGNVSRAWQRFKNVGLYPNVGAASFSQFGGSVPADFQLAITHTNASGTIYYTMDGSDPRLRGGAIAPTAFIYTQAVTMASPTLVRARVRSGTIWSAIVEAQFYPPQDLAKLQLSELMYNPPQFNSVDGDEFEFLELINVGTDALNLSGVSFTRGIVFTFTNGTWLEPGHYFLISRNAAQFGARYGNIPLNGTYAGKLDNAGESLTLSTGLGATLFSVAYDNVAPWPTEADNTGFSLQRMNFTSSATNPVNWIAAAPTPGGSLPLEWMDDDGDGMPNGWETAHGLDPATNDADTDADHDGLTNFQEFLAGSNPRDEDDGLRIETVETIPAPGGLAVVLGFPARSNKTYSVVYRDALGGPVWTNLANIGARTTNRLITVTDTLSPGGSSRFYRLVVGR